MMNRANAWTENELATLKRMWAEGATCKAIGEAVGRSRNAVIGKVNRMRISGELPERPEGLLSKRQKVAAKRMEKSERQNRQQVKARPLVVFGEADVSGRRKPPRRVVDTPPDDVSFRPRRIGIMALRETSCRWIVEGAGVEARFCGLEIARGSYCEHHAARAYEKGSAQ